MQSIHVMSKSTTTEHGRRLRTTSRSALQRLSGLWVMLAIVVVWQAIVSLGIYPAYAVPSPSRVLSTAWRVLTEKPCSFTSATRWEDTSSDFSLPSSSGYLGGL